MADKRTYEIVTNEGRMRMEIPDSWKVTYGPVSPGSKSYGDGNALRVYENETKQRAIFLNVVSFRDLSIPVQRLLVREKGSEKWEIDSNSRKRSSSVEIERRWVPEGEIETGAGDEDEAPF